MNAEPITVLITGGAGYLGTALVRRLAAEPARYRPVVVDNRLPAPSRALPGVDYRQFDVRDPALAALVAEVAPRTIVHLASIVNPGGPAERAREHSIDVGGTENVLRAAVAAGVEQLIVTSSGAAYGYHAENPRPLDELDPLRGNPEFAYADHKRQVEELLARYRRDEPQLGQLVFRPGTVLGAGTDNQITRLFRGRVVVGLRGCETPFVFIWDEDLAECLAQGIARRARGIYNLAGDGTLSLREIAARLRKPYLPLPRWLFRAGLALGHRLGLSPHGPERLMFLEFRPVLSNLRLKTEFGYQPRRSSAEVFDLFASSLSSGR